MPSLLAKLSACGLIVGGFAMTGDLGRLADRGADLLNATGVPTDLRDPEAPAVAGPARAAAPAAPSIAAGAHPPPVAPALPGRRAEPPRLPVSSPASLDLGSLRPGQRLTVWVGSPPVPHAFDIVDPATGEVLEQAAAGGHPSMTPRRLQLTADGPRSSVITLGTRVRLVPLGIARGGSTADPTDRLGPIRAIEAR